VASVRVASVRVASVRVASVRVASVRATRVRAGYGVDMLITHIFLCRERIAKVTKRTYRQLIGIRSDVRTL